MRLVNECRDLGDDAAVWQGHLLAVLNRMAGALIGTFGPIPLNPALASGFADSQIRGNWPSERSRVRQTNWMKNPDLKAHPGVLRFLNTPGDLLARTRCELVADREWYAAPLVSDQFIPDGFDDGVIGRVVVPRAGCVALLTLVRSADDRPHPARYGRVLECVLRELSPHLGRSLLLTNQPTRHGLTARQRDVLDSLLDGDSEKQTAARFGLHPTTVHDHVKRLYRHFGVNSRAELLAYFLRRFR